MKKKFFGVAGCALILGLTFVAVERTFDHSSTRAPASTPKNYEALSACDKQDVLWKRIQESSYQELPPFRSLGVIELLEMGKQGVSTKGFNFSDFAPEGWKKFLHARGSIAKIKIVPHQNKYTGLFQGADCGLLRLSLTSAVTSSRPVAPGLALKILRDKTVSTNISALVSLDGQGQDFNFFKYPMSNIVPTGDSIGQRIVHKIFLSASPYPEELNVREFAEMDEHTRTPAEVVTPRQLFFVPSKKLAFSADNHDVRKDFATIPPNTVIYEIRAVSDKHVKFSYSEYNEQTAKAFLQDSELIAEIVTSSEFISSSFGDEGIFFRHQLRNK